MFTGFFLGFRLIVLPVEATLYVSNRLRKQLKDVLCVTEDISTSTLCGLWKDDVAIYCKLRRI